LYIRIKGMFVMSILDEQVVGLSKF